MASHPARVSFRQRLTPPGFIGGQLEYAFEPGRGDSRILFGIWILHQAWWIEQLRPELYRIGFCRTCQLIDKTLRGEGIHCLCNRAPPGYWYPAGYRRVFQAQIRNVIGKAECAIHRVDAQGAVQRIAEIEGEGGDAPRLTALVWDEATRRFCSSSTPDM